jgi:hypothetical protein
MNLCRLCGDEKSPLDFSVELNDKTSSDWSYRDLIEHHTRVPLKSSKLLPQGVCDECKLKVDGFAEFSSKVQRVQDKLEDHEYDDPMPDIKECFVRIEEINEELLNKTSRKKRKKTVDYGEQDGFEGPSTSKRGMFESITIKVEPEVKPEIDFDFPSFLFDLKEETNDEEPSGRLRNRKHPVEYITRKKVGITYEPEDVGRMFPEETEGTSKFPHLHLDVPESCKLADGEVPEEFASKVSTLRWKDLFKCLLCTDVQFDSVLDIKNHHKEAHKSSRKTFNCHLCVGGPKGVELKTPSENVLLNHLVMKHFLEHLRFCCMVCSKMFYDLRSINNHYKTHEGGFFLYSCFLCCYTAIDMEALRFHKPSHSIDCSENMALCRKIQEKFDSGIIENPTSAFVDDHERNADGTVSEECQQRLAVDWSFGSYRCTKCDQTFITPFDLNTHNLLIHGRRGHEKARETFNCIPCEKRQFGPSRSTFESMYTFVNHSIEERHQDNIEYSCVACFKVFWNLGALVKHYKEIHSAFSIVPCNHCGKIFANSAVASIHYNSEVAEEDEKVVRPQKNEEFYCELCVYKTNTKCGLQSHIKYVHKQYKPEEIKKCELCGSE